jgi:hypothetical protein
MSCPPKCLYYAHGQFETGQRQTRTRNVRAIANIRPRLYIPLECIIPLLWQYLFAYLLCILVLIAGGREAMYTLLLTHIVLACVYVGQLFTSSVGQWASRQQAPTHVGKGRS